MDQVSLPRGGGVKAEGRQNTWRTGLIQRLGLDRWPIQLIGTQTAKPIQVHGLERCDRQVRGQVAGRIRVGHRNRAKSCGAGRVEPPVRVFDRDAVGGAESADRRGELRQSAQIRIGRRLADRRVLGGDDRAEARRADPRAPARGGSPRRARRRRWRSASPPRRAGSRRRRPGTAPTHRARALRAITALRATSAVIWVGAPADPVARRHRLERADIVEAKILARSSRPG